MKLARLFALHDIGADRGAETVDGQVKRGFEFYVGGGLGTVPQQAKLWRSSSPKKS